MSQRLESATPFVYAVSEVETSALEYSRNGMTKSASSLSLKLQVSARTLAAVLLLFRESQRLRKTETPQRKQTTGPRPEPDHLLEEPTFVTFLRGVIFRVHAFSRGSTVSQVLGVSDSVASGALRAMAGA